MVGGGITISANLVVYDVCCRASMGWWILGHSLLVTLDKLGWATCQVCASAERFAKVEDGEIAARYVATLLLLYVLW